MWVFTLRLIPVPVYELDLVMVLLTASQLCVYNEDNE